MNLTSSFSYLVKSCLLLLLCAFALIVDAQQERSDSLQKAVSTARNDSNKVITLNLLANEYLSNTPKKAYETAQKSVSLAQSINYKKGLGNALNICGEANRFMANYATAHRYYIEALRVREEIGDKKGIAGCKNNIGLVYEQQDKPEEALRYYFESLKLKEELGDKRGIAGTLNNIGIIYKEHNKDYPRALEYYERALKINRDIGNKQWELTNLMNIGLIYKNTKDYPKAFDYLRQGTELNKEVKNKRQQTSISYAMGQVHYEMGHLDSAEYYYQAALDQSKGIEDKESMARAYNGLSDVSRQREDYKNAFEYHVLATSIEKEVTNEKNNKEIAEMQVRYDVDKQEKAIELLEQKNQLQKYDLERKRMWIYIAGAGTLLLLLLATVLWNRYRIKQKANNELQEMNRQISAQKAIIQEKNKDITDSIRYAQKIQEAILPPAQTLQKGLGDHFILYIPKDIVSGDFYWYGEAESRKLIAAVDCTGHGVPGAFMSLVGYNQLNHALREKKLSQPSLILDELNRGVKDTLQREDATGLRDGMDIALCAVDRAGMKVEYAGAHNPLFIVRKNSNHYEPLEIKADKNAIGGTEKPYTNHAVQLGEGDILYIFSDGFGDQFGGEKQKKFTSKKLKELLTGIAHLPMEAQRSALHKAFIEWKGELEQVDDILLIGIRI